MDMISTKILKTINGIFTIFLFMVVAVLVSCQKQEGLQDDPYAGGMAALGVKFLNEDPDPNRGLPGSEVTFKVTGLAKYNDQFEFLINETKADIIALTDSTLTVKIPAQASSGGTTVILNGQSFFGPKFTIEGKIAIDPSFKAVNGTNGAISDVLITPDGNYMMVGFFSNFESQAPTVPVNNVLLLSRDGVFQNTLKSQLGAQGGLTSLIRLNTGQFIIAGILGSYNRRFGMNGITRLNNDGSLDSLVIDVVNTTPEVVEKGRDTVAKFNGGVAGLISRAFVKDDRITAIGSFSNYLRYYYLRSTRDFKVVDITKMSQMVRLKEDGTMDSTFNYNPQTKTSYPGGNGSISSGIMQPDGKVIAVGNFTTYNGITANRIVRIGLDGSVDGSFISGTGADDAVGSITQNPINGKLLLTGRFKHYNGVAREGVVLLNPNGSVDESFNFGQLIGGIANYALQLSNGKIVVSGFFNKYNNVVRQGFMMLNANGSLAEGYNNTGAFNGTISKILETTTSLGTPALLIVGSFNKFDNTKVGNIVKIELKN
jgi:hypothetical protein